jgi:hypothetical protein
MSNFHTTLFQNSFVLVPRPEWLIRHNIGTPLKHNKYIFDIPIPLYHHLLTQLVLQTHYNI